MPDSMPKHSNRASEIKSRLARRHSRENVDQKRVELITNIFAVSSSISLNSVAIEVQNSRQALDDHEELIQLIEELKSLESNISPTLPSRDDEKVWTNFFNWVEAENHPDSDAVQESKLDVQKHCANRIGVQRHNQPRVLSSQAGGHKQYSMQDDDQEYSLVAKVPISKGEKIFSMHRRVMLTSETATQDPDFFEFIKRDAIASKMQNVALVLHLLNEHSKGELSYWWPYLSILPRKILPILKVTQDRLRSTLAASSHVSEMLKMIRSISRQYAYFCKQLLATKLPLRNNFTYSYYCWGISIVCSRQNEIPNSHRNKLNFFGESSTQALIPILDMCNHDRNSNQATFQDNCTSLFATDDSLCTSGGEITINYGSRTSGEFFIHNGFVPDYDTIDHDDNSNRSEPKVPYDAVPISIVLNQSNKNDATLLENKTKLLKILNMSNYTAMAQFRLLPNERALRHKRDPHLTMFLIICLLTPEELEFILCNDEMGPVKVADEIYEHIQYNDQVAAGDERRNEPRANGLAPKTPSDSLTVDELKVRLRRRIDEYLHRRASIHIALIDRALTAKDSASQEQSVEAGEDESSTYFSWNASDDEYALRLLQNERSLYATYLTIN